MVYIAEYDLEVFKLEIVVLMPLRSWHLFKWFLVTLIEGQEMLAHWHSGQTPRRSAMGETCTLVGAA